MFSLHETTKLYLCRAAFVALCLLPSCAVAALAVAVQSPWYRRSHERALSTQLGWKVELGAVCAPRPGCIRYEWLEIVDPDTQPPQLLARLPLVEVAEGDEAIDIRLPAAAIINGLRLEALWQTARESLRGQGVGPTIRCRARLLAVHLADEEPVFADLEGEFTREGQQQRMELTFRPAEDADPDSNRMKLSIARDCAVSPAASVLQLSTDEDDALPCALLASLWPALAHLGPEAQFAGRVSASEQAGLWTLELSGKLAEVDLDQLVSRQFPHKLTGRAAVRIDAATIVEGRLESAEGSIASHNGLVSRSLLHSAYEHLALPVDKIARTGRQAVVSYELLSAEFKIDEAGLVLQGRSPDHDGAIIVGNNRALVKEAGTRHTVVSLVRTLVPYAAVQVPATRETETLARWLPLSTVAPLTSSTTPPVELHWVPATAKRRGNAQH